MRGTASERARAAIFALAMGGMGTAALGCPHHTSAPPPGGSLTVGMTSEDTAGALGAIHVTTKIDGAPATDETLVVLNAPQAFPHEIKLSPPAANPAAHVEVRVEGYLDPTWTTANTTAPPILIRTAEAGFVPAKDLLMRVRLEQRCITGVPGGSFNGPVCNLAHQTCIHGACQDDSQEEQDLEPYAPNWATNTPDECKPVNAGAPDVVVGTGQTDYLPLTDGQTVQAELGPQGGHHIWVALRQHNLKRVGSTVTITGSQPGGVSVPPTSFVFTFDPDEGGYCKLAGLRYQLDNGGTDYHVFLGKPLDIQVVVLDTSGARGTGVAHINVAPTVLCPNPSQPCN